MFRRLRHELLKSLPGPSPGFASFNNIIYLHRTLPLTELCVRKNGLIFLHKDIATVDAVDGLARKPLASLNAALVAHPLIANRSESCQIAPGLRPIALPLVAILIQPNQPHCPSPTCTMIILLRFLSGSNHHSPAVSCQALSLFHHWRIPCFFPVQSVALFLWRSANIPNVYIPSCEAADIELGYRFCTMLPALFLPY